MAKEIRVGVLAGHNIAHRGENCEKMVAKMRKLLNVDRRIRLPLRLLPEPRRAQRSSGSVQRSFLVLLVEYLILDGPFSVFVVRFVLDCFDAEFLDHTLI